MRWIALITLTALVACKPAQPDFSKTLAGKNDTERYRLALEILRKSDDPSAFTKDQDTQVVEAAVDASRERLADVGENPSANIESLANNLLDFAADAKSSPELATRALHAIAESHSSFGGRISARVAQLAHNPDYRSRIDAIQVLSELADGSQAATLAQLVNDKDQDVAEAAKEGLESIKGKGVTQTFIKGIADKTLSDETRAALLRAATKRDMTAVVPAAAEAITEPSLRLDAQKALLRLARKSDLVQLRVACEKVPEGSASAAALKRLIAKLEKE
jgi:hypothetical protein